MSIPFGYPGVLKQLSTYEMIAWRERVKHYHKERCHAVCKYRFHKLWRLGVYRRDGSLVRFFYERQAMIVATLWDAPLTELKTRPGPALLDSIETLESPKSSSKPSKGKNKRGDRGEDRKRG